MKTLILSALSILSLTLFSFAPPMASGVWRFPSGNYRIDPGATLQFTPADQSAVKSLMSQIYKQPFGGQTVALLPVNCTCCGGGEVLDTKMAPNAIETKYTKWNNCAMTAPGSPQAQLLSIIDRYAHEAPPGMEE